MGVGVCAGANVFSVCVCVCVVSDVGVGGEAEEPCQG